MNTKQGLSDFMVGGIISIAVFFCSAVVITGCSNVPKLPANMTCQEYNDAGLRALKKLDTVEAERLVKAGLKKAQAIGRICPEVATSLSNLAQICEEEGKDEEAMGLYEQALAINDAAITRFSLHRSEEVEKNVQHLADLYRHQDDHLAVCAGQSATKRGTNLQALVGFI